MMPFKHCTCQIIKVTATLALTNVTPSRLLRIVIAIRFMFCQLPADLQLGTRLPVRGRLSDWHSPNLPCLQAPILLPPGNRAMLPSHFDMAGIHS